MVTRSKLMKPGQLILQGLLWLYFIISVYPLFWMISYSFKNNNEIFSTNSFGLPTHFRIENYINAWSNFNIPRYFTNSVVVASISTAGILFLSIMFSYASARMEWKLRGTARAYMMIGMFIPLQVIMIPLAILVKELHLINTYGALIVPYIAFGMPFSCLIFYGFLRGVPFELEESACMDGASIYRTFFTIIAPIITPAIATVAILQFLGAWNEFLLAYILIADDAMKTLPLGLLFFQGQYSTDWGGMGAVMTIASLPTVIVFLFFSEQVERAMTVGSAVKG